MSDDRQRDGGGKYVETVTPERVLAAVRSGDHVVTAREVAETVGCSRDAALGKLNALHDRGEVERKKVGGRSVVWWTSASETEAEPKESEAA